MNVYVKSGLPTGFQYRYKPLITEIKFKNEKIKNRYSKHKPKTKKINIGILN